MADPKNKGMTAREAVERFCTYSDWAGTVSDDPEDTQRQEAERFPRRRREPVPRDAASELTKMLAHKVDLPDSPRARLRARENTPQPAGNDGIRALAVKVIRKAEKKGVLDRGVQSDRETAVFRAMKSISRDADQFDGPAPRRLWATGRRFGADLKVPHELIAADLWFFEGRGEIKVDIEANAAVGLDGGLEYVNLKIYDAEPRAETAQAPARGAQDDAAPAPGMVSARETDRLKPATSVPAPEPAIIAGDEINLGRPTLEPEIKAAYKEICGAGDINFDAPKNRLYEPIREKVRKYKGDSCLQRGLGKEAIRKVISPLFEADKEARAASP